jgi:hypothetical protein
MPSSGRQRLPAEIWRSSHNRHTSGSPVLLSGLEMQANPGLYEDVKEQSHSFSRNVNSQKVPKRHQFTSSRGSTQPLLFRHRADTLDDLALSENRPASGRKCSSSVDFSVSTQSSDSDSNVDYSSSGESSDAFAMGAINSAPAPSQVPMPPMEWLNSMSKSPLTVGLSLQEMLGCHVST